VQALIPNLLERAGGEAVGDVGVAEVLAHDGGVFGLGPGVVVAATCARPGEFRGVERVGQGAGAVIDVLPAVVGMEARDAEREARDLIDQIEVIQAAMPPGSPGRTVSMRTKPGRPSGRGLRRSPMGSCTGRVLSKGPRWR